MDWKNKTVLVTGAGGFIGSQLVEALLAEGAHVRAFARYTSRNEPGFLSLLPPELSERVDVIFGDLRDQRAIYDAAQNCDAVYHLGALISIPYSYRHPAEVAEVNFMGTLNVLMACRELGTPRVIHTSTSEVYGTARRAPIDEEHPLQGQSPYSASKIGADKLAESFYCAYNLPVVTVRPFNTFGPRQSTRAVIPTIITQALTNKVIRLGNLDTTRDFTYVSDTVRGFLMAGSTVGAEGGVFNLGTGSEIRIGDIANRIALKVGQQVEIMVEPERLRPEKSEVMRLISDNRLAREKLGWEPQVSLDEGLDQTIEWMRQHLDLYRPGRYEV
ncbi:MAG: SDR family NAD(P)-dependent oxidoreductase [Chloroflexi bacterium]|nr:SDR family NAD(P)-dependent oxidoreductase [Chloroflexota bacterium]